MQQLHNYALNAWLPGDGDGIPQYNAYTGEIVATASDAGLDFEKILDYGRKTGGPALRFHDAGLNIPPPGAFPSVKEHSHDLRRADASRHA